MEKFKYYGTLEKVVKGTGVLCFTEQKKYKVSYEIAKRGEKKLLFNAIAKDIGPFESDDLMDCEKAKLFGKDSEGRTVEAIGLLIKDIESNMEDHSVINGYAGQCEIGKKELQQGYSIHFDLINFLFLGNKTKVKKTKKGKRFTKSVLQLHLPDFDCKIQQSKDYSITKQLLKRQGGVLNTSTLITEVKNQKNYENVLGNVKKLCQLLSVARSTFINWGTCKIEDTNGNIIYELHGDAITRPYHGNKLINDLPKDTVKFLELAWKAYDAYEEIFDMKRFLYGYLDTFVTSFIESRSLSIVVLVDFLSSRWAIKEGKRYFFDQEEFKNKKLDLTNKLSAILDNKFGTLKASHKQAILSNFNGINDRPLDWKLKRLRKEFQIPVSDSEITKFIKIRNSLAHTSLFPDEFDSTQSYLFVRHFLDRVVLSVLGYEGEYFDIESRKEKEL